MKVALGKFASWGVRELLGGDLAAGVHAALLHYVRRLDSSEPLARVPALYVDDAPPEESVAFDVQLAPDLEVALRREARRQGVPLERVLVHAVLVYLAYLDSAWERAPES